MRAIAFGFEQAAALDQEHTYHQTEKSDAPPVNFFHSGIFFTFRPTFRQNGCLNVFFLCSQAIQHGECKQFSTLARILIRR